MRKITKKDKIKGVVAAWRNQYPEGCEEQFEKIFKKLQALKNPTEDDIEKAIGNRSWTRLEVMNATMDSATAVRQRMKPPKR